MRIVSPRAWPKEMTAVASQQPTKIRVKDVMTPDPVCADAAASLQELAELFDANEISGVPVVDAQNRLIGVVSKTDLIHRCLEGPIGAREGMEFFDRLRIGMSPSRDLDPNDLGVAEDFMSIDPVTARPDELLSAVARRMADERVHRVVVVSEGNEPVGIVTSLDALKAFPA